MPYSAFASSYVGVTSEVFLFTSATVDVSNLTSDPSYLYSNKNSDLGTCKTTVVNFR